VTRAHRLIVVWMAGALASVVGYRLHALRGAGRAAPPGSMPTCAPPPRSPADEPRVAIAKYLSTRYDEVEQGARGDVAVGMAYMGAPLVEVESEPLRRLLPHTRFFTTKLDSGYLHTLGVDLLVSFKRTAAHDDVRTCLSGYYDRPSRKFLSQFLGISTRTLAERREATLALAELLATATLGANARSSPRWFVDTYAEIWGQGLHLRDVVMDSSNGRVSRIVIANRIDRSKEFIVPVP
jgi:hypothetical protein